MYSTKKNILQLAALLKAHEIQHIVCTPGSRNSPLIHTFANEPSFICHSVVDERSAGFFALGIIQQEQRPVAVCCTSGTAVLNLGPAVAEAYYQQLPLLVISADRPAAWIGQMDGQTIPQPDIFNTMVKKSVNIPEIHTQEEEWYSNRMINEAILALQKHGWGPAHINISLSEPLFDFCETQLPNVRKINRSELYFSEEDMDFFDYGNRFHKFNTRMIIAGQMLPDKELDETLGLMYKNHSCVILSEHPSNINSCTISNFDAFLAATDKKRWKKYAPELLITLGGHITSKRLKELLRTYSPKEHWHISPTGEIADTFQCLTDIIEMDPTGCIHYFACDLQQPKSETKDFYHIWKKAAGRIEYPPIPYSDLLVVQQLMKALPADSNLHLASSSSIRYSQLFPKDPEINVYSNRGTNGIDGSVSTAVGGAVAKDKLTVLLTGDLSFFYDMNGLWNNAIKSNLRILINNNGGGEIFHLLRGLNQSNALDKYITASHETSAKGWAESLGFTYIAVTNEQELKENMPAFLNKEVEKPLLMEVFTSKEENAEIVRTFYHSIKIK